MIEQLFGSKTRVKLLHLFYTNPNRSFYVREITRKIDEQINSVRRELSNLLSIGIIKSDSSGNRLYYEVNQKYSHYDALKSIFSGISKKEKASSKGSGDDLASKLRATGAVELALLTGIFVREDHLPVDILVVGDVNHNKLQKLMTELEVEESRPVRYAVFNRDEYDYRRSLNDRFLNTILGAKRSVLIDNIEPEKAKTKTK